MSDAEVRSFEVVGHADADTASKHGAFTFGSRIVYPIDGDPNTATAIAAGLRLAMDVHYQVANGVTAADMATDIPSAVVLIGPEDSAHGYNRNQLRADLDRYINEISRASMDSMALDENAVIHHLPRLTEQAESDSTYALRTITVQFPDRTSVDVELTEIGLPFLPGGSTHFGFEILTETARLPDGRPVPQSREQLAGIDWQSLEKNSPLALHLTQLAAVFGFDDDFGELSQN